MAVKEALSVKPVTALGFRGMNNLPTPPSPMVDREKRITPHFNLNCDVQDSGVVLPSNGYQTYLSLADLHSLAGEEMGLSVMLGIINGVLTLIEPDGMILTPLCSVGPKSAMNYAEVNNRIYFSSRFFNGVYDLISATVGPWGIPPPGVRPSVSLCPGNMPPGKYDLCYTRLTPFGMSGNGPICQVEFQDQAAGLQLNNMESDFVAWISQVNGGLMFLSGVDSQITTQVPRLNPLRSLNIIPPPPFVHFTFAHGRFWGVIGRNLYYSEPNEFGDFGWFSRKTIPFLENLVMVAWVTEGLYVHSRTSTWFLAGTNPAKMNISRIGDGAIPGTLVYAMVRGAVTALDGLLRPEGPRMPLPVWRSPTGFVVGSHGGTLSHLTVDHLKLSARQFGASLFRWQKGVPQILTTVRGASQNLDPETETIFEQGKLF